MTTVPDRVHIDYIYNPSFDEPEAEATIVAAMPDAAGYERARRDLKLPKNVALELLPAYMFPQLNRGQEAHLFRQMNFLRHMANKHISSPGKEYERYRDAAIEIQKMLVTVNYRLVLSSVKQMRLDPPDYFETVEEALLPLIRSILGFDYSKGFKFSTYASWALINWGYRYRNLLARKAMTNIDDEYLVSSGGYREAEEEQDGVINDPNDIIKKYLSDIDERQREIVVLRIGLGPRSPKGRDYWTLEEIGDKYGLSKERVRQLESKAFRAVRGGAPKPKTKKYAPTWNFGVKKAKPSYRLSGTVK